MSYMVLSHQKRLLYEKAEPHFWRYAKGAEDFQSQWFEELLKKDDYILLLVELKESVVGFIIGQIIKAPEVYAPSGLTLMVDDFCVSSPLWEPVGTQLLNKIKLLAKIKGARQIIIGCFGPYKSQQQNLRGCVINHYQQTTFNISALKPVLITPINLNKLPPP